MALIEYPIPHHGVKAIVPTAIVLHDTGGPTALSCLAWFRDPKSQVSAHYVVDTDGTIYHCVAEDRTAWHAGVSELWGVPRVNEFSVGIEMVGLGASPYPESQLTAVIGLVTDLCFRLQIPLNRIVGHRDIARPLGRKVDPGDDFPWVSVLARIGVALSEKGV